MRGDIVTLAGPLFLFRSDPDRSLGAYRALFEKALRKVDRVARQRRTTMEAEIGRRVFVRMDVAALDAELGLMDVPVEAAGRDDAGPLCVVRSFGTDGVIN